MEEDMEMNQEEGRNSEDREERKMFKATCSDCGEECEVPFEPTPGKPVRCKDCFMKNRPKRNNFDGGRGGRFGGSNRFNSNRGPREEHDAVCSDCGKKCTVPFKPTQGKPVLCRDCFKRNKGFD